MKTNRIVLIIFCSAFIEVLLAPIRSWINFQTSTLLGFLLYFFFTLFCLKRLSTKTSSYLIFFYILLGILLIQLPTRLPKFNTTFISLPDFIIHLLGIIIGFFYFKFSRPIGIILFGFGLFLSIFMFYTGYRKWIHKLDYGSFSGIVEKNVPTFKFLKENGDFFSNENLVGKIVILDFWNTGCGLCYRRFPILQEKHIKYKSNPNVEFYAVNVPLRRDSAGQALKSIRGRHYTFPVLQANNDSIAKAFSFNTYPSVFIIMNGKKIVYYGEIGNVDKVIDKIVNNR